MLSFYMLAMSTAIVFALLAMIWIGAPTLFLSAWAVEDAAATRLVGRRAAALYSGIAIMFFIARHAPPSTARMALVCGLTSTCMLLAAFGLYDFFKGRASSGILVAVGIEAVFSLLGSLAMS